jgi:hypothetical protein
VTQYTIELDDDTVASIEAYLTTQRRVEHDTETNRPRVVALFTDTEDFITKTITQVITNVVEQFPTPAMREHLIAKRQAELAMEQTIKPKVTKLA